MEYSPRNHLRQLKFDVTVLFMQKPGYDLHLRVERLVNRAQDRLLDLMIDDQGHRDHEERGHGKDPDKEPPL